MNALAIPVKMEAIVRIKLTDTLASVFLATTEQTAKMVR